MTEGSEYQPPRQNEVNPGKERSVSPATERVAGFLRGKIGFEGTRLRTEGDEQGKGKIIVSVPDVSEDQQVSVFRFHDNGDIRQFHEMAKAAGGLKMNINVGEIAGKLQTFGIDKFDLASYEDFQDYQFLAGIAESLGRNPAIQKWHRKGLDR